jgi:hypothetical protein
VHFSVEWTQQSRYYLEFSDECLEVDGVFVTQVFDHFGWKEFSGRADAVRLQKSAVGLQPTAESLWADARCTGKFDLGSGLHE